MKLLLGIIALSFCLWGVGDIIRHYSASKAVIEIGDYKLTVEQFLREYDKEKQAIRNSNKRHITDDEMRKLDVPGIVVEKVTNSAIIEQLLRKYDIVVSKKSLQMIVHSLPEFQNQGAFSERIYMNALRDSGVSESAFLSSIRENIARTQLFHPLIAGYRMPSIVKEKIVQSFEAKYKIVMARLNVNDEELKKEPTSDDLKAYYEDSAEKYKEPESRDIAILVVDHSKLVKDQVTQADVDRVYEETKNSYAPKETRNFDRYAFENRNEANQASDMLMHGKSPQTIAKKFMPQVTTLKGCSKGDFPNEIGDELFRLELNKGSDVHCIGGIYYVYIVTSINKDKSSTPEQIKDQIRQVLYNDKLSTSEMYAKKKELTNKIDDGFGGGKKIEEISKETGMQYVDLSGTHNDSRNDQLIAKIPDDETRDEVLKAAFEIDEGQASQTISSHKVDHLSYVVQVRKIHEAEIPAFEKIADKIKRDYIREQKTKSLDARIKDVTEMESGAVDGVKKLKGCEMYRVSKKEVIFHQVQPTNDTKRLFKVVQNETGITTILTSLELGKAMTWKLTDDEHIVVALERVEKGPKANDEFRQRISQYLDQQAAAAVIPVILVASKKNMKIKIDRELIKKITASVSGIED
jgi:peptidyl-prolyl cis-trans isomerase D